MADHDLFATGEPEQERMDHLLRQSMASLPPPSLSPDFAQQLAKRMRPRRLSSAGRIVMALYASLAFLVSVWVMRSAAIAWLSIAVAIFVPLVLAAAVHYRQRSLSS